MPHGPALPSVCVLALLLPLAAGAQEAPRNAALFQRTLPVRSHAFEGQLLAGYAQGVGSTGGLGHVQDVAGVGFAGGVTLGYRFSPQLFAGVYASGAIYSDVKPDTGSWSLAGGIEAQWHFRPYRSLDPWAGLGVGYRALVVDAPELGAHPRHAIEVARIALGVDYRFNSSLALGPTVGVDLALFWGAAAPESSGTGVSTFVTAGIAARFDLGGLVDPHSEFAKR